MSKFDHQKEWKKVFQPNFKTAKRPFYNLMMFPYPSAEGLHVGNMYAFTGSDIYGRFKKLQGYDLFEPIGLDGFGIHSENYAIQNNTHPAKMAKITKKNFYRQLEATGNAYAWDNTLETYDPNYYKWTQWIFVQMFKKGLAYRAKASVNWCPSCLTVLADEQVIQKSQIPNPKSQTNPKFQIRKPKQKIFVALCERCETPVIKKDLEQWFFRITDYADRLVTDLADLDWSEKVKIAQRNWIGRSSGSLIKFEIRNSKFETNPKSKIQNPKQYIEVFTTRPDTLFGATYLVLAPEHNLIADRLSLIANRQEVDQYIQEAKNKSDLERTDLTKDKTGVEIKGIKAINPANNEKIPIFVADYVLTTYGTGAIMAVPAHDQRDFEFAQKYHLPIKMVICPNWPTPVCPVLKEAYVGEGHLVGSGKFDGMKSEEAKTAITKFVGGKKTVHYKLRDWLISRQRYWGPPIPIIYCRKCLENQKSKIKDQKLRYGIDYTIIDDKRYKIIAVPEKDLPVKLPETKNWRPKGTGQSPLANIAEFVNSKCPKCGGPAKRESDVSDTFLDSAWYYLGYLILGNQKSPASPELSRGRAKIKNQKFVFDKKIVRKWLPVDMYIGGAEHSVLHLLYVRFITYVFKELGLIDFDNPFKKFRTHGLIIKDGAKMSKSKGNVIIPDKYIREHGADVLRMYLMFIGPFTEGGDFRDTGITGVKRFLDKVRRYYKQESKDTESLPGRSSSSVYNRLQETINKVTNDIKSLNFNTAISQMMVYVNSLIKGDVSGSQREQSQRTMSKIDAGKFLIILSPFAPYLTEELWQKLGHKQSIFLERWPEARKIEKSVMFIPIMVNGKKRALLEIEAAKKLSEKDIIKLALNEQNVKKWFIAKKIKKTIYIPGKILNIVI